MQPPPKNRVVIILVILVVIAMVLLVVGLSLINPILQPGEPNTIRITAHQYYEGELDRPLLLKVLKNQSYDPDPTSETNSIVRIRPYCGEPDSAQANSTRALFSIASFYLKGDNTSVEIRTKLKSNTESNRNVLEDTTNCAFDRLAQIMKDYLNMSLAFQNIDMKKFTVPGFETVVVIAAVAVVVGFYKYKKVPR